MVLPNNHKVIILISVLLLFAFTGCVNKEGVHMINKNVDKLVTLENSDVRVGILTNAGGRIVLLQKDNGENILKSDPSLWDYMFTTPVRDRIINSKIQFNGHIVWVGPQSEWWAHQNINSELKKNNSRWPPDPYLIYGDYAVIEKSKEKIKLLGPDSEYSGLRLEKTISIDDDGLVKFFVEAENIRNENVAWDLWLNTRIDGLCKAYVPFMNESDIKMEYRTENGFEKMPYQIKDDFFFFTAISPSNGVKKIHGKSLIYPSMNKIFAFTKNEMFAISFSKYDKNLVHPEQGMVEIYNSIDDAGDALLELEYHAPYKTLKPGEKMNSNEIWQVVKYYGGENETEHISFIKEYLSKF